MILITQCLTTFWVIGRRDKVCEFSTGFVLVVSLLMEINIIKHTFTQERLEVRFVAETKLIKLR